MRKSSPDNKKLLKELTTKLKALQTQLAEVHKREGNDPYLDVVVGKNQAYSERIKKNDERDRILGKYYLEVNVTAKQEPIFIPLSIASGKKVAGFMYQIEGTEAAAIETAEIRVHGEGVSQVTVGTLRYVKIQGGGMASFQIRAVVRGFYGKKYKIVITRINYKLKLTDARYQQYVKEIPSAST